MTTYPTVHPDRRTHAAHGRVPPLEDGLEARRRRGAAPGTSTSAIAAMPAVVPEAEQQQQADVVADARDVGPAGLRSGGDAARTRAARTITTTLLSTGAYAAATNRRRALSSAVASAVKP